MRVAIEAASLGLSSGGLARYTAELSLALARCFPDDEFFLISDQPFRMPPGGPSNLERGGGPRNSMERRWWLWGMAREMSRLGADLVHGPDFAVPYIPRRPSVLTLHDLSPWMKAALAPRGQAGTAPHPHIVGFGDRHHGHDSGRGGAEAGHRAVPAAPGPGRSGAGSGGGVVSSGGDGVLPGPGDAVFPLRGHARAAQEPAGAGGGLARSAAASPRRTGAGRAAARGFSGSGGGAGAADDGRGCG